MIEQVTETTFKAQLSQDRLVEIGDSLSANFKPAIKLKAWDEVTLDLALPTTQKFLPTLQNDKLLWSGTAYGAEFFQSTDGFKFNVILPKRPKTNVFPLEFNASGLIFNYQPPLTEEFQTGYSDEFGRDIASVTDTEVRDLANNLLVYRPENIVGSYAVRSPNKSGDWTALGGNDYGNGKAWHWMRPLIYDAIGKKTWGVLNVDPKAGIRTVTIDQKFLDTAIYPVTIDDEFGDLYAGTVIPSDNRIRASLYTCPAAGTATSMKVTGNGGNVRGVYYLNTGGAKIDETVNGDMPALTGTTEMDFAGTPAVTAAAYYLGAMVDTGSLAYDAGSNAYKYYVYSWDDAAPANLSSFTSSSNRDFGISCVYTPGGGGGWAGEFCGVAVAEFDGVVPAEIDGV